AAVERALDHVGHDRESAPLSLAQEWSRRKEVDAQAFGRDVAVADIGSLGGWQALRVAAARCGAVEVEVGSRREQVADAGVADTEPSDLLEDARRIRIERLTAVIGARRWSHTVTLPGRGIRLASHVRQRVQPVFGFEDDFIYRYVGRALALRAERAVGVQI